MWDRINKLNPVDHDDDDDDEKDDDDEDWETEIGAQLNECGFIHTRLAFTRFGRATHADCVWASGCLSMDPAVLIFLLYVMIAHELVCGLVQYQRQAARPRKRTPPLTWCSSSRVCQGTWRVSSQSVRASGRDWKKSGRIVRKA